MKSIKDYFFNFFFELLCIWAGLKHFYSHFRSGFTIIYGENYAFLTLFTKALRTDGATDGWTDTPSYRDASKKPPGTHFL